MYLAYRYYQWPLLTTSDLLDESVYCYLKDKHHFLLPGSNKHSSIFIGKGTDCNSQEIPLMRAAGWLSRALLTVEGLTGISESLVVVLVSDIISRISLRWSSSSCIHPETHDTAYYHFRYGSLCLCCCWVLLLLLWECSWEGRYLRKWLIPVTQ